MTTAEDLMRARRTPKGNGKPASSGVEILAAMSALRDVLDALPNSREELEALVERAREALNLIDQRIAQERVALRDELDAHRQTFAAMAQGTSSKVEQTFARIAVLEGQIADRLADLDVWLEATDARLSGLSPVEPSMLDDLRRTIEGQVRDVLVEVEEARRSLGEAVEDLKKSVDNRFKATKTVVSAPPTPTKIYRNGTLVGERRGLNFVPGSGVSLAVTDNGNQVDVAVSSALQAGVDYQPADADLTSLAAGGATATTWLTALLDTEYAPSKWPTGTYLISPAAGGSTGTALLTSGRTYYNPVWIGEAGTIDSIEIEVTAGATGGTPVATLALYSTNATTLRPETRLADFGTVDTTLTGVLAKSVSHAIATPGLYWVALSNSGATTTQPTLRMLTNGLSPFCYLTSFTANGTGRMGYFQSISSPPATATPNTTTVTNLPLIAIRRGS